MIGGFGGFGLSAPVDAASAAHLGQSFRTISRTPRKRSDDR
jgi:hypothetical protein